MRADWIKTRQTKYTAYAAIYIIIVIAVLVMINFLSQRYNKSFDSTANKQFSLSDQTKKVVGNLKSDLTIIDFDRTSTFSSAGGAKDILDRYSNLSPKVHVDYIDPVKKPDVAREKGFKGPSAAIQISYQGRTQEAKSSSEEDVTGAIIRVVKGNVRNVCVVAGTGEHSIDDTNPTGYSFAKELLEKSNYKTQTLRLVQKPEIPKECTVLVIGGPTLDYIDPAVQAIKTYVEGGGRALFAIDPPLSTKGQQAAENAGLVNTLAGWGVTLHKDVVIDPNPVNRLFGFSAAVVLVGSYGTQPVVRDMKDVGTAFPLCRSMEIKSVDKSSPEKLFESSADSFGAVNMSAPSPNDPNNKKGPLTLGAASTYNNGQQNNNGRFVVVGSSRWMENDFLPTRNFANRDLFLNMMNWLSSDEDLISIRPKEPEDRRLTMNQRQASVLFYSCVIGLPLIVIVSGLGVWWRRR
jgi:ABC-type uncharacterized transport system involved in gliding motility auxiliary subunit